MLPPFLRVAPLLLAALCAGAGEPADPPTVAGETAIISAAKCYNCALNLLVRHALADEAVLAGLAGCKVYEDVNLGLHELPMVLLKGTKQALAAAGLKPPGDGLADEQPHLNLLYQYQKGGYDLALCRAGPDVDPGGKPLLIYRLVDREEGGWRAVRRTIEGADRPGDGEPVTLGDQATCLNRACEAALLAFIDGAGKDGRPALAEEYFLASNRPMPPGVDEPLLFAPPLIARLETAGSKEVDLVDWNELGASIIEYGGKPVLFVVNGSDIDVHRFNLILGEGGWKAEKR